MLDEVMMAKSYIPKSKHTKNKIGTKFGDGCVIIAYLGSGNSNCAMWLAECKCGQTFKLRTHAIKQQNGCRICANKIRKRKDVTGVIFGDGAIVIDKNEEKTKKFAATYWNCRCPKCQMIFTATTTEILSKTKRKYGLCKICTLKHKVWKYGKAHHNYNHDLTKKDRFKAQEHRSISIEGYPEFIHNTMKRDNYKCILCNSNRKIVVHHLDGFHWCKEKRTDINNGITLCNSCHRKFHSIYGIKHNTKKQFIEFQSNDNRTQS